MVRRTWKEIMPELPPTTRVIEPVEISGSAYVNIEAAAMRAALAHGSAHQVGYLAALRRKLAEVKVKPALEIALQAAADGHKVVLWVWHNEVGDRLLNAIPSGMSAWRLQSSDPAPLREQQLELFREHTGPAFLVASMGVGGVGLDLSCADYAIFVELDWTPAVVYQAEMRTFHKDRPHIVVYLYADDPVETALIAALDVKNSFAAAIGLSEADILRKVIQ
jgi:superfamily II DNA or RNA helicase